MWSRSNVRTFDSGNNCESSASDVSVVSIIPGFTSPSNVMYSTSNLIFVFIFFLNFEHYPFAVLVAELMATFSEGKTAAARSGVGVVQDTPVVQGGIKTSGGYGRE